MWAEASSAVNPNDRDELDKEVDGRGGAETAKKMKRAKEPAPMVASEGLEDSPNPANSQHLCAKNVVHEEWGEGEPVPTMHADPDEEGNIAWYDVMFEHGVEKGVSINELKVVKAGHHMHASYDKKKKKDEALDKVDKKALKKDFDKRAKDGDADIDNDGDEDDSDKFLHKKRKAISKAIDAKEEVTIQDAQQFKVASMKEALAKVWGLDEWKNTKENRRVSGGDRRRTENKKGGKTDTGGKMAEVEIDPELKDKK